MIKLILYITKTLVAILVALLVSSCQYSFDIGDNVKGSGKVISETRQISEDFTNVEVSRGIEVEITQSTFKAIEVRADDNIINHIKTVVEDGVLIISLDNSIKTSSTKRVIIAMPNIESLRTSSGSSIESNTTLIVSKIDVRASSGSDITLTLEAEDIHCESSSGSGVTLEGKALKLETSSSSGSNIDAQNLLSNDVTAKSSSGSSIKIHPILSLNAKASSGSAITYHKNPKVINKKTSSGGSINSF
jgi:hypothetical protein